MVELCQFRSHSCDKMSVKDDLRKEEFVWTHSLSVHSTMVGAGRGDWRQGCEVTGRPHGVCRWESEMNAGARLTFFFLLRPGPQPVGCCCLKSGWGFLFR